MTDDLISEIKTIGSQNQELIDRIKAQGSETMKVKNHYVTQNEKGNLVVEEILEDLLVSDVLENWKKAITLKKPIDLFNDKIDYNCTSYKDIVRLSESMLGVIDKFLFLDPKRAISELEKFKVNFITLQASLNEVEGSLFNTVSNTSKLSFYLNEVQDVNERINHLLLNPDVIFGSQTSWQTPSTSHRVDKNRASLISGQSGCVLSTKGYKTGTHKWKLKMISRTSTCMLGVAPSTVNKNGVNYSSNGYYMNLDDGSLYSGPTHSYSNRACVGRGIQTGSILVLILNCDKHTLTYNVDGTDYLAYENLPTVELFLAFDNNTTAGSEIEMI